jgi:hypothetical protein
MHAETVTLFSYEINTPTEATEALVAAWNWYNEALH